MKYQDQEATDYIADQYNKLKKEAEKLQTKESLRKFKDYQNFCMEHFRYLVTVRASKYRSFMNYEDLVQDGFEALLLALRTYKKGKGAFTWWADKYISTRISRSANAHSTIRFPIKKAREVPPTKISSIPVIIDESPDPFRNAQASENSEIVSRALKMLPETHQQVMSLVYGLRSRPLSIESSIKKMKISKSEFNKIMDEAKSLLKAQLVNFT